MGETKKRGRPRKEKVVPGDELKDKKLFFAFDSWDGPPRNIENMLTQGIPFQTLKGARRYTEDREGAQIITVSMKDVRVDRVRNY